MRIRSSATAPAAFIRGTEAMLAQTVTAGVDDTRLGMQDDLRGQIIAAGLPRKLANIVRSQRYPQKGVALDPAGIVFERPKKPGSEVANLVSVFATGVTINARNRRWLALPAATVKQGKYPESGNKRHRVTPAAFERSTGLTLRFVPHSSKLAFLVADMARTTPKGFARQARGTSQRRGQTVVCFILVPQVSLRRRIDWPAAERRAHAALPDNITRHWK